MVAGFRHFLIISQLFLGSQLFSLYLPLIPHFTIVFPIISQLSLISQLFS